MAVLTQGRTVTLSDVTGEDSTEEPREDQPLLKRDFDLPGAV